MRFIKNVNGIFYSVLLLGIIFITAIYFSFYRGYDMSEKYYPLVDATMVMKLRVARANLFLEKKISGDFDIGLENIKEHVNIAKWYANAMIHGGKNYEGVYIPIDNDKFNYMINIIIENLDELNKLITKKYRSQISLDNTTNELNNLTYLLENDLDELEEKLKLIIEHDLNNYRMMEFLIITGLIFSLMILLFIIYKNEDSRLSFVKTIKKQKSDLEILNDSLAETIKIEVAKNEDHQQKIFEHEKVMLEESNMAALGALVAGFSHEINTPIGLSITSITHLIDLSKNLEKLFKNNDMSEDDFKMFLKKNSEVSSSVYKSLQRTADLINSFKKVSVDQSTNHIFVFPICERINDVIVSLNYQLKKKKITVKLECNEELLISNSPGLISQIFTNLITNSLIHGFVESKNGTINISVYEEDSNICIIYKDNGKGIKEDIIEKIFDRFFTTKKSSGGSGLGMHIVHNIVTSHLSGTIEVKSELGEGVEFKIVFSK